MNKVFDSRKALLVPINSSNQIFIQDRRGHKKPDWGYFGGEIVGDETPLQAVIREAKEELQISIRPQDLNYMGTSETVWDGLRIIRYMFLYPTEQVKFDVLEGKGGHWLSAEDALKRLEITDKFVEVSKMIKKSSNKSLD